MKSSLLSDRKSVTAAASARASCLWHDQSHYCIQGFAESLRLSTKAVLLSANPLPRVALGKDLSAHLLLAKRLLPRAIYRALGKEFAESHIQHSANKNSRYAAGGLTATLLRAAWPSSRQRFIFFKIVFAESLQQGSRQSDIFFF
jgi:hypothetical protein